MRPDPGTGEITVTIVVARLLEASGTGVEAYVRLIRRGELDTARRDYKFSSEPRELERLRRDFGRIVPDGVPDLAGDVTWRRATGRWSLDVTHGLLSPGVHWWEQVPKDTGDAQLRLDGINLPDTVVGRMPGRPLREFVEHPVLDDPAIVVREATSYPPVRFNGTISAGSLQIRLDVPRLVFPDAGTAEAVTTD